MSFATDIPLKNWCSRFFRETQDFRNRLSRQFPHAFGKIACRLLPRKLVRPMIVYRSRCWSNDGSVEGSQTCIIGGSIQRFLMKGGDDCFQNEIVSLNLSQAFRPFRSVRPPIA